MSLSVLANTFLWGAAGFWWLPPLALATDVAVGDPVWLYHPVRAIGFLARRVEPLARKVPAPVLSGGLSLVFLCFSACLAVGLSIWVPSNFHHCLGALVALYWAWSGLALGCLWRMGKNALTLIEAEDIEGAREAVSHLVTRDVSALDKEGLCRTLAESLSENLNDGFVAPFFWLMAAGPLGLWLYKTVNTMDSLWGYKTERWLYLGRAAARADDLLAYIPARLTALFLLLSARFARLSITWPGWRQLAAEACLMESPNAGWPMAAAAWLHGASVGGTARYHGKDVEKPVLGPKAGRWDVFRTRGLVHHILVAGVMGGLIMWLVRLMLSLLV